MWLYLCGGYKFVIRDLEWGFIIYLGSPLLFLHFLWTVHYLSPCLQKLFISKTIAILAGWVVSLQGKFVLEFFSQLFNTLCQSYIILAVVGLFDISRINNCYWALGLLFIAHTQRSSITSQFHWFGAGRVVQWLQASYLSLHCRFNSHSELPELDSSESTCCGLYLL